MKTLSLVLLLLVLSACGGKSGGGSTSNTPPSQENSIDFVNGSVLGVWGIDVVGTDCIEIYTFDSNQILRIDSNLEDLTADFSVIPRASSRDEVRFTVTDDDDLPDCEGGRRNETGNSFGGIFVEYTGEQMLWYDKAQQGELLASLNFIEHTFESKNSTGKNIEVVSVVPEVATMNETTNFQITVQYETDEASEMDIGFLNNQTNIFSSQASFDLAANTSGEHTFDIQGTPDGWGRGGELIFRTSLTRDGSNITDAYTWGVVTIAEP